MRQKRFTALTFSVDHWHREMAIMRAKEERLTLSTYLRHLIKNDVESHERKERRELDKLLQQEPAY